MNGSTERLHRSDGIDQPCRVDPQCVGYVQKFDQIDASSATLDGGDDGLVPAQPLREIALGQSRPFTGFNQQFDQSSVTRASEGLGHRNVGGNKETDSPAKPSGN